MAFVLLWSTGFVAAKAGLAHADTPDFSITSLRTGNGTDAGCDYCDESALADYTWLKIAHIAIAGTMHQAVYFGGTWLSIASGVGVGVALVMTSSASRAKT